MLVHLASVRTTARLDGDHWIIDGQKIWMTFGTRADWIYVLCRTNPALPKHQGLSLLAVPADQAGVDRRPIRNLANGREFAEVFFTGARTDASHIIGEVDQGWRVALTALSTERGFAVLPFQMKFESEMAELSPDCPSSSGRSDHSAARCSVLVRTADPAIHDPANAFFRNAGSRVGT
jgi:Acyl-CoA dehydrogenase, middle domain